MKRRDAVPAIPPFIDFYGRPTFENPAGQNRPNPALTAGPAAVITEPQPIHAVAPPQPAAVQELASVGVHARRSNERLTKTRARMQSRVARVAAVAVAIATTFVGMTAASAYFTSSGSGSGNASTGTLQAVTASATGTVNTKLIPNNATADLVLQVTNPNGFPITITGISQPGTPPVTAAGGIGTCTTTGVTVPTQSSLSTSVTAINGASQVVHIANGAQMDTTSDSGCQNATFTIPVTLTVKQS